jgi:hypothetical protein
MYATTAPYRRRRPRRTRAAGRWHGRNGAVRASLWATGSAPMPMPARRWGLRGGGTPYVRVVAVAVAWRGARLICSWTSQFRAWILDSELSEGGRRLWKPRQPCWRSCLVEWHLPVPAPRIDGVAAVLPSTSHTGLAVRHPCADWGSGRMGIG